MDYFDPTKMPTPLLAIINIISNIFFSIIGGIIVYLWNSLYSENSVLPYYGLLFLTACYITLIVLSYTILRAMYNRYVHYIELRLYTGRNNVL